MGIVLPMQTTHNLRQGWLLFVLHIYVFCKECHGYCDMNFVRVLYWDDFLTTIMHMNTPWLHDVINVSEWGSDRCSHYLLLYYGWFLLQLVEWRIWLFVLSCTCRRVCDKRARLSAKSMVSRIEKNVRVISLGSSSAERRSRQSLPTL